VKALVENSSLPFVRERIRRGKEVVRSSLLLKVFGPTETEVRELLQGIKGSIELAYLSSFPEIHLKVVAQGANKKEVEARLKQAEDELAERLGIYLFGRGAEEMEGVVGRLLREKGSTIAVAESCTGGLIAHRITEIPGSSNYFLLGVVAYSNQAKEALLAVPHAILERYGPISKETAEQMAVGVRESSGATIGIATTGIAGPTGGTPENPVGRVFIALATEALCEVKQYELLGNRHEIKRMAAELSLDMVRRYLLGL
jgi:nicotinamide-nucleotide amidase